MSNPTPEQALAYLQGLKDEEGKPKYECLWEHRRRPVRYQPIALSMAEYMLNALLQEAAGYGRMPGVCETKTGIWFGSMWADENPVEGTGPLYSVETDTPIAAVLVALAQAENFH